MTPTPTPTTGPVNNEVNTNAVVPLTTQNAVQLTPTSALNTTSGNGSKTTNLNPTIETQSAGNPTPVNTPKTTLENPSNYLAFVFSFILLIIAAVIIYVVFRKQIHGFFQEKFER